MKGFWQKNYVRALIVVGIGIILIMWNPYGALTPLRATVQTVFAPFQYVGFILSHGTGTGISFMHSIGDLKQDNQELHAQNQLLEARVATLADTQKENDILRAERDLLPRNDFDLISAEIIGVDNFGKGEWLTINRGSMQDVTEGASVIVANSVLIGTVHDVYPRSSRVMLLTHPQSAVNAVVSETDTKGVVHGNSGFTPLFDNVLQEDHLVIGEKVITSALGGAYPRGLLLGSVQEVYKNQDGLTQSAIIASPADIVRLRFVSVIKE